jgi:hypothetical protein
MLVEVDQRRDTVQVRSPKGLHLPLNAAYYIRAL